MDVQTGNQQGKDDLDLAWLAGFIDGEGSFMVLQLVGKRLREKNRAYMAPRIGIANTDAPTLDTVTAILDNQKLPYHIRWSSGAPLKSGQGLAKDKWHLTVQGFKRCQRWCRVLIPYLRTKKREAETMLELSTSRLETPIKGSAGRWYSDEELALAGQLRGRRTVYPHRLHAQAT